jgi:hypothetical protein
MLLFLKIVSPKNLAKKLDHTIAFWEKTPLFAGNWLKLQ